MDTRYNYYVEYVLFSIYFHPFQYVIIIKIRLSSNRWEIFINLFHSTITSLTLAIKFFAIHLCMFYFFRQVTIIL